jgi:hypothetical protein
VIDLERRALHVLRNPTHDGYGQKFLVDEAGTITPIAAPRASIAVATIFP